MPVASPSTSIFVVLCIYDFINYNKICSFLLNQGKFRFAITFMFSIDYIMILQCSSLFFLWFFLFEIFDTHFSVISCVQTTASLFSFYPL